MFSLPQGLVLRHKAGASAATLPYATEDFGGPPKQADAEQLAAALQGARSGKMRRLHDRISAGSSCMACQKAKRKCDGKRPCARCAKRGTECVDGDAAKKHAQRKAVWAEAAAPSLPTSSTPPLPSAEGSSQLPHPPAQGAGGSEGGDPQPAGRKRPRQSDAGASSGDWASSGDSLGEGSTRDPSGAHGGLARYRPHHRFNSGYFLMTAQEAGVSVDTLVTRLASLLTNADDDTLLRSVSSGSRYGGMPLRLLEPVARWLGPLAMARQARMVSMLPPPIPPSLPALRYDGLHLTITGLAACLGALNADDAVAVCPTGYPVIMAVTKVGPPPAPVREWVEGGDVEDLAGSHTAPLAAIFRRWLHLPRVLCSASPETCDEAGDFLAALGSGELRRAPLSLCNLFHLHVQNMRTACFAYATHPDGFGAFFHTTNDSAVELMGMRFWPDPTTHGFPPEEVAPPGPERVVQASTIPKLLHPDTLLRRALAFLAAGNLGMKSFQFEGQYLRSLPTAMPGILGASAASNSPFYAVETVHMENHPTGEPLMRTTYLSDMLFVRSDAGVSAGDKFMGLLSAAEQLSFPSDSMPLQMRMAVRRTGKHPMGVLRDLVSDIPTRSIFAGVAVLINRQIGEGQPAGYLTAAERAAARGATAEAAAGDGRGKDWAAHVESRADIMQKIQPRICSIWKQVRSTMTPTQRSSLDEQVVRWQDKGTENAVFHLGSGIVTEVKQDSPLGSLTTDAPCAVAVGAI